jgi:hypothetical protein
MSDTFIDLRDVKPSAQKEPTRWRMRESIDVLTFRIKLTPEQMKEWRPLCSVSR